ncbi:MAG: chitobiase/beta-hexosaminidase C-terminal domain-containing protein [Eubacterium sp.]|nr:chitobiase/beta-hexosaminidase C-terminal domain-containing protein [Eubacterium sp.]
MQFKKLSALMLAAVLSFVNVCTAYTGETAEKTEPEVYTEAEEVLTEEACTTDEEVTPEEIYTAAEEEVSEEADSAAEETVQEEVDSENEESVQEETDAETEELISDNFEDEETEPEAEPKYESIAFSADRIKAFKKSDVFMNADLAEAVSSDADYSYRSLLTDDEKKIYDAFDSDIDYSKISYKTITYNDVPLSAYMYSFSFNISETGLEYDNDTAWAAAMEIGTAYFLDHAEFTWMSDVGYGTTRVSFDDWVTEEVTDLDFYFFAPSDSETTEKDMAVFDEWKTDVISKALTYNTYYDRLKYAQDAICNEVSYAYGVASFDESSEAFRYAHSSLGVICSSAKQLVCEGYTRTFKLLCDEMDIPCIIIESNNYSHMWNVVKMDDGEWYGIDVTWDDDDDIIYYDYFLKGENVFKSDSDIAQRGEYTNPFSFDFAYNDYDTSKAVIITEATTETTTEENYVAKPTFKVVGVFGGRSVTFTSETDGAVIYYSSSTSNITTDDILVQNGETVTYENYYGTIYAKAYYNGYWSNVNKFVLKIPVVNTPTVTASGSTVTIKSTTPSSFICYTTDGSEPVVETDGTLTNGTWLRVNGARTNSGTITANPGDTVRAVAVRNCFTTSESASAYITLSPAAFKVVGTFGGRNVTFTSDTSGAKIYYSFTTSSLTTDDKCVSNGETVLFENFYGTIYARAYYDGKWSNVSRLILKIPTINDPTITYSGGKATIRTTTPNCYIYYTTDGSTPSITNGKKLCSNSYGQVSISSGTTIKAIAVRSCFTNSTVTSYTVS